MIRIREEQPGDGPGIRRVLEAAFHGSVEADLVEALRGLGQAVISLVAEESADVAGHILFSPVRLETADGAVSGLGLAPLSVLPERQRQGIGSALAEAGLRRCRKLGCPFVVVLGHPEYYPRFGFEPAAARGLRCEFPSAPEAFMALELESGSLGGKPGTVKYAAAFDRFASG